MLVAYKTSPTMIVSPISKILKSEWPIWLPLAMVAFVAASLFMSGWPKGLLPELTIPFNYDGDGMAYLWNIQRAIEGTWYFENNRSGFPFGSNHLDYPTADTGSYLVIKLIALFFHSPVAVHNLYYLIGFPVCVAASYWVSRTFDTSKQFSVVIAFIYAFTTFHFGRLLHLFFTWYFVAPLFLYIGCRLFSNQLVFTNKAVSNTQKTLNAVALVGLSSFGIYYSFFGCIVLFLCLLMATTWHRSLACVKEGVLTLALVCFGVFLNILPSLIFIFNNGSNREGVNRLATESEIYGLKITQMLIPRGDHRLDSFFEFSNKYNNLFPLITENVSASIGAVGSIGFVLLCITLIIAPFYKSKGSMPELKETAFPLSLRLQLLSVLTITLVLIGTIGGYSSLFAMLVSSSIRSWNRISIFIAFICVLACLMTVDALTRKYLKTPYLKFVSFGLASVILVLGLLDQTAKPCHSCLTGNEAVIKNDKAFISSIEKQLPKQAAIYQLPYMPYSDAGMRNHLGSYDQARGVLNSENLRWSFGGVRGRTGDWFYRKLSLLPLQQQITVVTAMGFAGIYIDKRGYPDEDSNFAKRCEKYGTSQTAKLKHNCLTSTELDKEIYTALIANGSSPKMTSQDKLLDFYPIKSLSKGVDTESQANAYLKAIGFKLVNGMPEQTLGGFEEPIDLRKDDPDLPVYAAAITGVSNISIANGERVGRWSDRLMDNHVTVWLAKPLPKKFSLTVSAQAAGLNTMKPMKIQIGDQTKEVTFEEKMSTKTVDFELNESVYKIVFKPADPFSTVRRWGYGTNSIVGVMFETIQITPN